MAKIRDFHTLQKRFLTPCDVAAEDDTVDPFTLVIFGGGGDLSQRKLIPSLYHLFIENKLPDDFAILGLGRREKTDEQFQAMMMEAIRDFIPKYYEEKKAAAFVEQLHYLSMDVNNPEAFQTLCHRIKDLNTAEWGNLLYYLSVPPEILPVIVKNLNGAGLCRDSAESKIIVEKPFGRDRESGNELNRLLLEAFEEKQIYRIDHYLGKETVQNLLFFRFGNSIFEPMWNRRYVDHVQIMVAEDLGIEQRGNFYEQAGVIRDIVQNHALQLLALVAMEPPVGFDADLIRDEKVKVYRTIRPVPKNEIDKYMIRGQYGAGTVRDKAAQGYREEESVDPQSNTPTYFAGKFMIDNWRWSGVPFYIRSGKRMPRRQSEIYVQFHQPPLQLFGRICDEIEPNALIFSIQPDEELTMRMNVKIPGMTNRPQAVDMDFNYEDAFQVKQDTPYERLLIDAIRGDLTLFARQDAVEAMWGVVDPIIKWWDDHPAKDFPNYKAGTWGPKAADKLLEQDGHRWRFHKQ
ncbi:glucose-6-phosphate dehydrogenase [candidate division KSB1 bacterium]|nr:glucose-6-phosphate dehydrogenase [candidate division KSB1 bacterium]